MTQPSPRTPDHDSQETTAHDGIAGQHTESMASSYPDIWERLSAALADAPMLQDEISRLRVEMAGVRLDRANLAAAALAAIAAHHDGETDPLSYLRDELSAQGYDLRGRS